MPPNRVGDGLWKLPKRCGCCAHAGPLPPSWGNLTQLSELSITDAVLVTGPVPATWTSSLKLQRLELSNLSVSGALAPLGNISTLTSLALRHLPGVLPPGGLPALVFNASLTDLTVANVSGWTGLTLDPNIPSAYPNISKLALIGLGLVGEVPSSWQSFRLQQLRNLYLSANALNGTLPNWLASKVAKGFGLDLSLNNFAGMCLLWWLSATAACCLLTVHCVFGERCLCVYVQQEPQLP